MSNIYPPIELNEINKVRISYMLDQIKVIEKDLKHYQKLCKRYKRINLVLKVLGFSIGGVVLVGGTIIGIILTDGIIIPLIFAGSGALETIIPQGTSIFIVKSKHKFQEKADNCKSYLDKLFIFMERAKEDKVISIDELSDFQKILNEYSQCSQSTDNNVVVTSGIVPSAPPISDFLLLKKQIEEIKSLLISK